MVPPSDIEITLHRLYIAVPGASLRKEDRKKVAELAGLLNEVDRIVKTARSSTSGRAVHLVDAAAGKAYVGLLAAELILAKKSRPGHVTLIERDSDRAAACRQAIASVRAPHVQMVVREADVGEASAWPAEPDLVVALHACGPASDMVVQQAVACRARHLLLVPCCTCQGVPAAALAQHRADALGVPRQAEVRRRFIQAMVDSQRTLALEAAGYETTVIPFVPPTLSPHNLLWRARRVGERRRMAAAAEKLARFSAP